MSDSKNSTENLTAISIASDKAVEQSSSRSPWKALSALCVGFFMILMDMTIVAVAQLDIGKELKAGESVFWVTSIYLLTYAVPLLLCGRLGDRFGPKPLYLGGLVIFTLSSAWCGFSESIGMLIVARGVQGLGAAMIAPQTMAVITRIFPVEKRGSAMGVWGSVAGVATLAGPILGGVLVDHLGWEWVFFINIPFGILGLLLAWLWIPELPKKKESLDLVGIALSGVALCAVVYAVQEGNRHDWDRLIWLLISAGLVIFVAFLWWESRYKGAALVPLGLFKDRNFSLASIAIASQGFAMTAIMIPVMFFLQLVGGMSATEAALMMAPMAIATGIFSPLFGALLDRVHPSAIAVPAFVLMAGGVAWLAVLCKPDTPVWLLLLPTVLMGIAGAGVWGPLSATATRNLPVQVAGAGSGVYNTSRMIGSVLGSAGVAAVITWRLSIELPGGPTNFEKLVHLPQQLYGQFSAVMEAAILMSAVALVVGVVASLLFQAPQHLNQTIDD